MRESLPCPLLPGAIVGAAIARGALVPRDCLSGRMLCHGKPALTKPPFLHDGFKSNRLLVCGGKGAAAAAAASRVRVCTCMCVVSRTGGPWRGLVGASAQWHCASSAVLLFLAWETQRVSRCCALFERRRWGALE
jgi:hypothetical protein